MKNSPSGSPARLAPIPALLRRGFAGAASLMPGLALANPTGGQVVSGQVDISTPSSGSMVITQGSNSAIVNWQTFSIGGKEYVQFIQPSSSSVILNRVIGNSPSQIFGNLSANGRVFLINPDGVLFAPGSSVDVGALVASTVNISDSDFKAGHYVFSGATAGAGITNKGTITAHDGGFIVLHGDYVNNSGVIQAKLGEVVMASGSAMTLSMDKGGLINYTVDKAALSDKAGVVNSGQLLADGGRVIMTAEVAHGLVSTAVNNSGLIRAQGISQHNGEIELTANGGDIVDSGTLDASSKDGNGGAIELHSDNNIDLQSTARLLDSGANQGGNIHVVADGTLSTRAHSLIDAHAVKKGGKGGYVEISGHGKTTIRGDFSIGHGGALTIDPTDLTIASGSGTNSSGTLAATWYEQNIESLLKSGTDINLVATNSITMNTLADHELNGTNNGNGGSLLLGIGTLSSGTPSNAGVYVPGAGGTISFQTATDTIKVDHDLKLNAGTTTGVINVGNLQAGRITLTGNTSITTGTLKANLGNMSISGGNITAGSIDVTNSQHDASSLSVVATGNITVNGGINVTGGGGAGSADHSSVQADAFLSASGNVKVTGNITVTGNAFARNTFSGSFNNTGDGDLAIEGNKINLAGVTVSGVGDASFEATANQSIVIGSAVNVTASRATIRRTGGSTSINESGNASILLGASSSAAALTITTHGLSATGPNAGISVTGGTLNLNNGPTGVAISAKALTGGTSTGGSGAFYQHSYGGGNGLVTTDFGAAGVFIDRVGGGTTKIGSIAVSGPAALLQLQGSGGVTTVNGSISVQASGYTVTGSASQFPPFRLFGSPVRGPSSMAALLRPPIILTGTTHWGAAEFFAGGPSANGGDTFNISGGVTVAGIGEADVAVKAAGLSVGGAVSVTATKGSLQGINVSSYFNSAKQSTGTVTRTISNSAGTGAATFGQANVTIDIGNSANDVSLGSLNVRGLSAQASFQGGRNLTINGNVNVDGQFGGAAPDYKEVARYVPFTGPAVTGTTRWVGDNNFLRIGGTASPTGSVSLGNVSLSGYGFVDLVVRGNSVSMGDVSVTQGKGLFTSTDKTRYSTSYSVTDPGTVIDLAATSGPVQATSLTITSTGPLTQSLSANIANAYSVTAPSFSSVVSGITGLPNPLLTPAPTTSTGKLTVPSDKTLLGISVTATDIALNISGNLALTTQSLAASNDFSIQTGGNLSLTSIDLSAGSLLSLSAAGSVVATNSTLSGSGIEVAATSGSIALNNSLLIANSIGAVAGTSINITHSALGGPLGANGSTPASLIALSADGGDITLDDATALTGDAIGLFATGSITSTNLPDSPTIINAGALSAQAFDTIDLTQATLVIGTGTAQFGSDPNLLKRINELSGGKIVLPATGPNASFKAKVVNLGTIQTQNAGDDLYLYIESLATTSGLGYSIASISGAGNALLDYNLYGGDVQVVNVPASARPIIGSHAAAGPTPLTINGSVNAPAGLTTLIIGSSLYGGDISVSPGTVFTPNDPGSVNLVFATTGNISGADNLHTTGYVLLLNQLVNNPVDQLPITPGDYTPPPTGGLGNPQPAPGDPDDPGVNDSNEGTIVQQGSSQGVLSSCSGT